MLLLRFAFFNNMLLLRFAFFNSMLLLRFAFFNNMLLLRFAFFNNMLLLRFVFFDNMRLLRFGLLIFNNYPPKWRWIVKYILPSREAARWIFFTRHRHWVVLVLTKQVDFVFAGVASSFIWRISSSVTVAKRAAILKVSSGGEYPRIYRVWWTNQNARKVLSTCLVNTNFFYPVRSFIRRVKDDAKAMQFQRVQSTWLTRSSWSMAGQLKVGKTTYGAHHLAVVTADLTNGNNRARK